MNSTPMPTLDRGLGLGQATAINITQIVGAGVFATARKVGEAVEKGQEVARIEGTVLRAPLPGCLRGLTHDGAVVAAGAKVIEVDPRGNADAARGLGERPQRIAQGVLAAVNADHWRAAASPPA